MHLTGFARWPVQASFLDRTICDRRDIPHLVTSSAIEFLGAFVDALQRHQLLESFVLDIRLDDGSDNRLAGFHTIDEARLQALDGTALERLSRDGHLLPVYMVLASLSRFRDLIERMNRRRGAAR